MVSVFRVLLYPAIFAWAVFPVSAESAVAPLAPMARKKVKGVEPKTVPIKKAREKTKSILAKNDIDPKASKNDEAFPQSEKESSTKPALRDFESEADHKFRKDLVLRVNELILKAQKESPTISAEFSEDRKLDLLKVFTAALGDGVRYVPALDLKSPRLGGDDKKRKPYYKSIIIATGKVLYLRIDIFNDKTLNGLRADASNIAELDDKPLGMIVDLRSANGSDYDMVAKAVDLFVRSDKKLNASKTVNSGFFETPIILLVDANTKGSSEVFAAAIVNTKRGISLGEPTDGTPFKKRKIMLANGDYLLIPVIPKKFAKLASTRLNPDIRFAAKPQITYERLKAGGDSESSDKCVARAVELLICLNAISIGKK